jgi:hypothetical protein
MGRDAAIHRGANTGRATQIHTGASDPIERVTEESNIILHGVISLAVAAARWVGSVSPGDDATYEFPRPSRLDRCSP